jgi:glutamate/tyrosine decarboxylase-like PLP-dependent enzyme
MNMDIANNESLITRIEECRKTAEALESTAEVRGGWTELIMQFGLDTVDRMNHLPAFEPDSASGLRLHGFSESGITLDEALEILKKDVFYNGLNPASGGHLGYIPGGGLYLSALADYMADVTNKYAGIYFAAPGAVRLENLLIEWLCRLFGFPETALGNLTSGGSIANLAAIVTARDTCNIQPENIRKSVIYGSEHMHHCLHKAIRISGLQYAVLRNVPLDDRHRMDAMALESMVKDDKAQGLKPFLIIGSVGTTDTGAVDPLVKLGQIAGANNCWFHIDAAYGGFFKLLPELNYLFEGIERADSIVIDPHKGMFLPYGTGAVIVKNGDALRKSHFYKANYMQDAHLNAEEPSPADLSAELTKHFRGLRMWLPMKVHGLEPFKACLREKYLLTRYFRQRLNEVNGFEMGPEPDLSVTYYRLKLKALEEENDELNLRLVEYVRNDGRVFVSSSVISGRVQLRLAVLSFRTTRQTIDILLEILVRFVGLHS